MNKINLRNLKQRKLRVLTWHVHGNYLYYLTQSNVEFYLPFTDKKEEGYVGKTENFPWGNNVHEVPFSFVNKLDVDLILFQSKKNYLIDQYEILSPRQRALPRIYLEHDPPRKHPTDTPHVVKDKDVVIVHVTNFNNLMWDNEGIKTKVIEHGVKLFEDVSYKGNLNRGIVVINNLQIRGRRLGLDIFEKVRKEVPLDIIGINSEKLGGLGEIPFKKLHSFISSYRFFFSPIRYTSLGLSICEAMLLGMPIVGFSTSEMSTVIKNGVSGFVDTDINYLIKKMNYLLSNPEKAYKMGQKAKAYAQKRFNINRFTKDWQKVFQEVAYKNLSNNKSYQKEISFNHQLGGTL